MLTLKEVVSKYLEQAGEYGRPLPLSAFGLSREEAERTFGAIDEDYQISRYIHLSDPKGTETRPPAVTYQINGFRYTHVSIDAEIKSIL
jgi:hypothetical protein